MIKGNPAYTMARAMQTAYSEGAYCMLAKLGIKP